MSNQRGVDLQTIITVSLTLILASATTSCRKRSEPEKPTGQVAAPISAPVQTIPVPVPKPVDIFIESGHRLPSLNATELVAALGKPANVTSEPTELANGRVNRREFSYPGLKFSAFDEHLYFIEVRKPREALGLGLKIGSTKQEVIDALGAPPPDSEVTHNYGDLPTGPDWLHYMGGVDGVERCSFHLENGKTSSVEWLLYYD